MVALLLLVLKHDDEAASSDPHLPSSALPAKYALESLSLSFVLLLSLSLSYVYLGGKKGLCHALATTAPPSYIIHRRNS
jgi:hypothetical protein